jgi:hypothetical protein
MTIGAETGLSRAPTGTEQIFVPSLRVVHATRLGRDVVIACLVKVLTGNQQILMCASRSDLLQWHCLLLIASQGPRTEDV